MLTKSAPKPDRAALEVAHAKLNYQGAKPPLEALLKSRKWKPIINRIARAHMKSRAQFDPRKAQANDND